MSKHDYLPDDYKGSRLQWKVMACPSCGFIGRRRIFVMPDGSPESNHTGTCTRCKLEYSAYKHTRAARELRARIAEIDARRAKKANKL